MKILGTMIVLLGLLAALPAHAQDVYGAIAFGHSDKAQAAAYGFAWNYAEQDDAEAAARGACSDAGGADCAVFSWFRNGCGALAMDRYGRVQASSARSIERAEERAMRGCESGGGAGCAIVEALCTEPGKRAETWSGSDSVLAVQDEPATARRQQTEQPAARDAELSRKQRAGVQSGLAALGFDAGPADGMFGPRTRTAIREWQEAKGFEATGFLTRDQADALAGSVGRPSARPVAQRTEKSTIPTLTAAQLKPKCWELTEIYRGDNHAACWQQVEGRPGCHVWNEHYHSDQAIRWAGACPGGVADGRGTYSVSANSKHSALTSVGSFSNGKPQGRWVERWNDGTVVEGVYSNGQRHGRWLWYYEGATQERIFVRGEMQARTAWHRADGRVSEYALVDGEFEGAFIERRGDGEILEYGWYVKGNKHGRWITRRPEEYTYYRSETDYRNGKQDGQYVTVARSFESNRTSIDEDHCAQEWKNGEAMGGRHCRNTDYPVPRGHDQRDALWGEDDRKLVATMERSAPRVSRTPIPPKPLLPAAGRRPMPGGAGAPVRWPRSIGRSGG